jgi:hypothetical protein
MPKGGGMKVIVIRQPWAWLIIHGGKDIENRSWRPRYRGPLLIQASARVPTKSDLDEARLRTRRSKCPLPERFETGGIVGMVQFIDCVSDHRSKWFSGPVGWVLSESEKLEFIPLKGRLGLFDPPPRILRKLGLTKAGLPSSTKRRVKS